MDITVLYNPSLCPVTANQTGLVSCRWSPWAGCLCHFKPADSDIVKPCLFRIEAGTADADFYKFVVRVIVMEIGIDDSFLIGNYGKPLEKSLFRF